MASSLTANGLSLRLSPLYSPETGDVPSHHVTGDASGDKGTGRNYVIGNELRTFWIARPSTKVRDLKINVIMQDLTLTDG
eukprot:scaffold2645_cov22-Cyclotella_meneghiniana.AAC.1